MALRSKQHVEPVGIDRLLELLNEAEGLADRDPWPFEGAEAEEPEALPPHLKEAGTTAAPDAPVEQTPAENEAVETADDLENRFAAHIVRGMSKSKRG